MQKEKVLITGGTGLIGKVLTPMLLEAGYEVNLLSRNPLGHHSFGWDVSKRTIDTKAFAGCAHLVHLAGEGIADKRWSSLRKQEILNSRVDATNLLIHTLQNMGIKLSTVVAASAVGYYGFNTSSHVFTEADSPSTDFLGDTCRLWENATAKFIAHTNRLVTLRIGVVLDNHGGALPKMAAPVRYGVGAPLGKGAQYLPWIHVYDLCRMIVFSIQHASVSGTYNAVASQPVTNKFFTQSLAKVLHKPLLLPAVPAFLVQLIFGEMSVMVLEGSAVSNKKIKDAGFAFTYETLETALKNLLLS